jgi:hypothetical protein
MKNNNNKRTKGLKVHKQKIFQNSYCNWSLEKFLIDPISTYCVKRKFFKNVNLQYFSHDIPMYKTHLVSVRAGGQTN